MPRSAERRSRLTPDLAVCTGWLTDLSVDRPVWAAMDARVSTQIFVSRDPESESVPLFDLEGSTAGTAIFHGETIIVLQSGSRQLCFGVSTPEQLTRWMNCFLLCASPAPPTVTAPVSVSQSLLRSIGSRRPARHVARGGVVHSCDIPARFACIRRIRVFGTPSLLLVIGELPLHADAAVPPPGHPSAVYRILRFDRTIPCPASLDSIVREDTVTHSAAATIEIVRSVFRSAGLAAPGDDGDSGTSLLPHSRSFDWTAGSEAGRKDAWGDGSGAGGSDAHFSIDLAALLGVIQLSRGYYLVAASRKVLAGTIGAHSIYSIAASELIPISLEAPTGPRSVWQRFQGLLSSSDPAAVAEGRYHSLLLNLDLCKEFFFSYTYDVTRPLQQQLIQRLVHAGVTMPFRHAVPALGSSRHDPDPQYLWNDFLAAGLVASGAHTSWCVPLAHGFFKQTHLSIFGKPVLLTLIARRSRFFAGTRYLKRGTSADGFVANDVETEQIVDDTFGKFSSFVQMRGSVPVFWAQRTSVAVPKPPITLQPVDLSHDAARRHFGHVMSRAGAPVLILNLVKKKERTPRERLIGREFARAVSHINRDLPPLSRLQYVSIDYSALVKLEYGGRVLLSSLRDVGVWAAANMGFFCNAALPAPLLSRRVRARASFDERRGHVSFSRQVADTAFEDDVEPASRILPASVLKPQSLAGQTQCVYLGACAISCHLGGLEGTAEWATPSGRWQAGAAALSGLTSPPPDETGRTEQLLARWAPHLGLRAAAIPSGHVASVDGQVSGRKPGPAGTRASESNEYDAIPSLDAVLPSYFVSLCRIGGASALQMVGFLSSSRPGMIATTSLESRGTHEPRTLKDHGLAALRQQRLFGGVTLREAPHSGVPPQWVVGGPVNHATGRQRRSSSSGVVDTTRTAHESAASVKFAALRCIGLAVESAVVFLPPDDAVERIARSLSRTTRLKGSAGGDQPQSPDAQASVSSAGFRGRYIAAAKVFEAELAMRRAVDVVDSIGPLGEHNLPANALESHSGPAADVGSNHPRTASAVDEDIGEDASEGTIDNERPGDDDGADALPVTALDVDDDDENDAKDDANLPNVDVVSSSAPTQVELPNTEVVTEVLPGVASAGPLTSASVLTKSTGTLHTSLAATVLGGLGARGGRVAQIDDSEHAVLEDQYTAHCRDSREAAIDAGIANLVVCATEMQDSTTVTAEGRMHREIAVRCRDAQRVGGRAEYTYMDLRGTPHGYHGPETAASAAVIFDCLASVYNGCSNTHPDLPLVAAAANAAVEIRKSRSHERGSGGLRESAESSSPRPSFIGAVNAEPPNDAVAFDVPATLGFRAIGLRYQAGILRTNCVDCLDRTNVAQSYVGLGVLGMQLYSLGLSNSEVLEGSPQVTRAVLALYLAMGDAIAMQYGGSEANKKVSPAEHADETRATAASDEASARSSESRASIGTGSTTSAAHMRSRGGGISRLGGHSATEFLSSLQRYYANSFTDSIKQAGMNLFLGLFQPRHHHTPLWELDSDFMLHNPHMMRMALGEASIVASEAAAEQFEAHQHAAASASSAQELQLGAAPESLSGLGDWWSASLQHFESVGLPRLQLVIPRHALEPPPPLHRASTLPPLLEDFASSPPRPTIPGPSLPESLESPRSPRIRLPLTAQDTPASTATLSRGGAAVRELTLHPGRLTSFDDVLGRPHVAPVLALPARPATLTASLAAAAAAAAAASAAQAAPPLPAGGPVSAAAHASGGGVKPSTLTHHVLLSHGGASDGPSRRLLSFAAPSDPPEGGAPEEGGLQLSTVRPLDAWGRRLPSSRLQAQQASQAAAASAVSAAAACSTTVLPGAELAAPDDATASLFADVLAAAGLRRDLQTPAPTAAPPAAAGVATRAVAELRGLATAVTSQVTAAAASLGPQALSRVQSVTASVVGAAQAVGSAAASVRTAATVAVASRVAGIRRRSMGEASAAQTETHSSGTPSRRPPKTPLQRALPGAGGATVVGGVKLPPWLTGNPDVVVSPSGSVTLMRREERMARMRASDTPLPLQLRPTDPPSPVITAAAAAPASHDDPEVSSLPPAQAQSRRRRTFLEMEQGVREAGREADEPTRSGKEVAGDDGDGGPARAASGAAEALGDILLASPLDSAEGVALLLDDGEDAAVVSAQPAQEAPEPSSARSAASDLLRRTLPHSPGAGDGDGRRAWGVGTPSLADPLQYPPVDEASLIAALREEASGGGGGVGGHLLLGGASDARLYLHYAALARTAGMAPSAPAALGGTGPLQEPPTQQGGGKGQQPAVEQRQQANQWSMQGRGGDYAPPAAAQHAAAQAGAIAGRDAHASAAAASAASASRVHILTQPEQVAIFRRHVNGHRPPAASAALEASSRWQSEWGVSQRLSCGPHAGMPYAWLAYPLTATATANEASAHLPLYRRYLDTDPATAPVEPVPCLVLRAAAQQPVH